MARKTLNFFLDEVNRMDKWKRTIFRLTQSNVYLGRDNGTRIVLGKLGEGDYFLMYYDGQPPINREGKLAQRVYYCAQQTYNRIAKEKRKHH